MTNKISDTSDVVVNFLLILKFENGMLKAKKSDKSEWCVNNVHNGSINVGPFNVNSKITPH